MTVSSSTYKNTYTTNGTTTVFPYTFRILDSSHIRVDLVTSANVTTQVTSGFTVDGVDSANGGNITFTVAPTTGQTLVIRREMPFTQETNYTEYSALPAIDLENNMDRLMMSVQQIKEITDRSLRSNAANSTALDDLPLLSGKSGYVMIVNADEDGFDLVPSSTFDRAAGANPPFDYVNISGSTISITLTNGSLTLSSNGTGRIILGQATSAGINLAADQPICDSSNNEYIKFVKADSAVNEITINNSATGTGPIISATGGDSNIEINFQTKGTGTYNMKGTSTSAAKLRLYEQTTNGTNYIELICPSSLSANRTYTLPSADGSADQLLKTNGSGTWSFVSISSLSGVPNARIGIPGGRLGHSAYADATITTNLYYYPYISNTIPLYYNSAWGWYSIGNGVSCTIASLTSGKLNDIFAYYNGSSVIIYGVAWTNDTTRATALTTQDGVYVLSGDATRRYLGTVYVNVSSQILDLTRTRHVYNMYNKLPRIISTGSFSDTSYNTASYRQYNGSASADIEIVNGLANTLQVGVSARATVQSDTASTTIAIGIGLDSTTVNDGDYDLASTPNGLVNFVHRAEYSTNIAVGRHTVSLLQKGHGSGTQSWRASISKMSGIIHI